MEFTLGVILYLLGSGLVALCLFAVPGPHQGEASGVSHTSHPPGGH